ncbi:MAG TPA: M4 family metallopeptidase [Isosphaeraceae bacterium]|nr:M4 family metallopeptidase [Isosphaeraceae bacterium]
MAVPFHQVRFHIQDQKGKDPEEIAQPRVVRGAGLTAPKTVFDNDEAAARYYLGKVMDRDLRPVVRGITAESRPEIVPDMRLQKVQEQSLTGTRLVSFEQTQASIPIFGSRATVELDKKRGLVAVQARIAEVDQVPAVPSISQKQALASIAQLVGIKPGQLESKVTQPASLTFFYDSNNKSWHLSMLFEEVPFAPAQFSKDQIGSIGHGLGRSPRDDFPVFDYLVDAHDGEVLFYYSKAPTVARCSGIDELGVTQTFYGEKTHDGFELHDALRRLKTYDLRLADLTSSFPKDPIRNPDAKFASSSGVSAHVNAARVYDFYKSVLMRDGVDDKGMELVSVVNCTYSADEAPPQWRNAIWWKNRMWYGQTKNGNSSFQSFSRYLDVIAHELTHGVTQFTAGLVYRDESGALDESFSDIFGVIINNWYTIGADSSTNRWNWEIGPALGKNGLPFRDMSNPMRTSDPDHMDDYKRTTQDSGGVHTNSNIHNKAAYNVLTAQDARGVSVFSSRDVAVLYYLCLSRLGSMATFVDALQSLIEVAKTFYSGDPGGPGSKVDAILDAYKKVGIVLPP